MYLKRARITAGRNRALDKCGGDDLLVFLDDERPDPHGLRARSRPICCSASPSASSVNCEVRPTVAPWRLVGPRKRRCTASSSAPRTAEPQIRNSASKPDSTRDVQARSMLNKAQLGDGFTVYKTLTQGSSGESASCILIKDKSHKVTLIQIWYHRVTRIICRTGVPIVRQ